MIFASDNCTSFSRSNQFNCSQDANCCDVIDSWILFGINANALLGLVSDTVSWCFQQGGPVPFSKFEYVTGWLFRELTSISLMIRAHCSRVLTWRNRRYLLKRGGIGEELKLHSQQLFVWIHDFLVGSSLEPNPCESPTIWAHDVRSFLFRMVYSVDCF